MATDQDLARIKKALDSVNSVDFNFSEDSTTPGILAEETGPTVDVNSPTLTTIDWSNMSSVWPMPSSCNASNVTINGAGSLYSASGTSGSILSSNWPGALWTTNTPAGNITTNGSTKAELTVKGDAKFDGDITWKGRSLGKFLESIEQRLAILTPDPEKLEKYEALRKAYEHYKILEKLIGED